MVPATPAESEPEEGSTDEEADRSTYGTMIYKFTTDTRERRGTELSRNGMVFLPVLFVCAVVRRSGVGCTDK